MIDIVDSYPITDKCRLSNIADDIGDADLPDDSSAFFQDDCEPVIQAIFPPVIRCTEHVAHCSDALNIIFRNRLLRTKLEKMFFHTPLLQAIEFLSIANLKLPQQQPFRFDSRWKRL